MGREALVEEIGLLKKGQVRAQVSRRLKQFEAFRNKSSEQWFSELCFCLLTANSKAKTAMQIQSELGAEGFYKADARHLKQCLISHKHRFHNNKTRFIIEARQHKDIKERIQGIVENAGLLAARQWLVDNVKGLGYKEASHFLRNVGYKNVAILDRHILNLMLENGFIEEKPKFLNKKRYLEIEERFKAIAEMLEMSAAELDLFMWSMKTGEVLK